MARRPLAALVAAALLMGGRRRGRYVAEPIFEGKHPHSERDTRADLVEERVARARLKRARKGMTPRAVASRRKKHRRVDA